MSKIRQAILETLSQHGSLPIDEIARAARRSVIATRYHLALLVEEGLVSADKVVRKSNVGRPQALYALADSAHEKLPKQYGSLAEQLLEEITHTLGEKEKRALLRRVGKRLALTVPPVRPSTRVETRLNHTVDFLTTRGYMAHWQKSDDEFVLNVCNCPYRQVALAHRQVCDMDVAMIGELVNLPMKMSKCIASQDGKCTFIVKPKMTRP